VGLTIVVKFPPGDKSGVVVDDLIAAIRLEARSGDCPSWRRRRFPSDVDPLTEREGAKGAEKAGVSTTVDVDASDITASSSENVFRTRRAGMVVAVGDNSYSSRA
jgi:hypothetical protein